MIGLKQSTPPGVVRLYLLCFYFGIGASVWGYNIGIMSSVFVHSGWKAVIGSPSLGWVGTVASIYYTGTFISYLLISHPLSDWLGRRYAALGGTIIVCLGAILQASSHGNTAKGTMLSGRLISGIGVAIVSTSVPLYQAEISPARKRGHFVTMNHVGFIAGIATGLWVGYFMSLWRSDVGIFWGWRLSIILEVVPASIFGLGLPWIPETPRWLVEKNEKIRARSTLRWLREGSHTDDQIEKEFGAIVEDVGEYRRSGRNWLSLFREKPLFSRLWRAALLQFMSQASGASAMKYYLPLLLESLGFFGSTRLIIGAIEMTVKIGLTVVEMFIIDRFGRRNCLATGCVVMAVSLLINGALPAAYPEGLGRASQITCVAFIFIYAWGFSIGFGPTAWVYNTEIFPTAVRARGLNFASVAGSFASMLITELWPLGIGAIGSNIYFVFMALNLLCIPAIYLFLPETKGRELEDMDALFGGVQKHGSETNEQSEHLLVDEQENQDLERATSADRRAQDRDLSLIQ
ncbi:Quinate permease [Colletotrichum spinosum]|uniref:Quinate permease n=1 Tax=Colletotrichum spinosum TaxID=1347390 RepID=A0A4R8Q9D7_9PEZI|nr:Quinate permease [Colletotrichum spinosum]